MFKPIATRFLQHLTAQNLWSREHLKPYAGKTLAFEIALVSTYLHILPDGSLCLAGDTAAADATVHISPSLATRLLSKDEDARRSIKIEGDIELASALGKILPLMRWDIEEDLSHVIGDIPAYQLVNFGKKVSKGIKNQAINTADMLSEYWQEEQPVLAKKRHVSQFNAEVDRLRNDVARAEKRLEKLSLALQTIQPKKEGQNK